MEKDKKDKMIWGKKKDKKGCQFAKTSKENQ